jgi:hypothetical protein
VVTAIIQLGIVYKNYIGLVDAVRSGARVAMISRQAADPVGQVRQATARAAGSLTLPTANVSVSSTWQPGADVTVSATYPYTISIFGIPVRSGSLSSSTTQRVE